MESSRGFALIVVLWFLVLIAALSAYLLANARHETAIARNIVAAASAEALADAGLAQAVFNQLDTVEDARWTLDGVAHLIRLPDGEVTIRLFDERQKINPNRASDTLLAALFEAAGVERPLARRIGASVADWVDRDPEPRPLGAELNQYASARGSYAPPNMPVESLDELQLVLGMTPRLFAAVRPYVTIHVNAARPDGKNAPAIVQRALILDFERTRPGESMAGVPPADAEQTAGEPAAAEADGAQGDAEEAAGMSPVIALEITARASNGGVFVRDAVLRLDPTAPKGYVVLDWRRGDLTVSD